MYTVWKNIPTGMVDFYGFHVGKNTSPMDPMGNETEWGLIFQYTFGISWSLVKLSTTLYVVKVLIRGWGPVELLNFWNFHGK